MFDTLIADGIADAKRIYITGGSNGGMMTYRLVCQLADRLAGAGVLVATLPKSASATWPKPSRPVPMIIMLGTVDPIVRYEGTAKSLSADATVAHWRELNECVAQSKRWDLPDSDPKDCTRVHAERWECKAPLVYYQLEGHGHGWPMSQDRRPEPPAQRPGTFPPCAVCHWRASAWMKRGLQTSHCWKDSRSENCISRAVRHSPICTSSNACLNFNLWIFR